MESEPSEKIMNCNNKFFNTQSVDKSFSFKGKTFSERVARYPKVLYAKDLFPASQFSENLYPENKKNIFSLRIDVDEFEEKDFLEYISMLAPYRSFVTLFCCVSAFNKKEYLLNELKSRGFDIQAHGFYHHVYNDYESNYNNIFKAKDYFNKAGINTTGFAAPMGKYNESLMLALEKNGFIYSSDFSFDYLNFPHYPRLKGRFSKILQVPVFPICPELLLLSGFNLNEITSYYDGVVAELLNAYIPIIIYNHTDARYPQVKGFLKQFLAKIAENDKLYKCNMSNFALWCLEKEDKDFSKKTGILNKKATQVFFKIPDSSLLGMPKRQSLWKVIKTAIKNILDFETVTPESEIRGSKIKKTAKLFIRKIKGGKYGKAQFL